MGSNPISRSKRITVKKKQKIEMKDLLHNPRARDTAMGLLKGKRDFDVVFEDQNYYLRARKVNQPNLGPWNLFFRNNALLYHDKCGIIAQPYSVRHGESGRPFCTKCGKHVGRAARQMLLEWQGETFPVRREGLQAFFLSPSLPKILEAEEEVASPSPMRGQFSARLGFGPRGEIFAAPEDHPAFPHDPHDRDCLCDHCCGQEGRELTPDPVETILMVPTMDGAYRNLEFPLLGFKLAFPRNVCSEGCYDFVRGALENLPANASKHQILQLVCQRAGQYGMDPDLIHSQDLGNS